jgi:DNA-binding CsgD family transcriptional regulator
MDQQLIDRIYECAFAAENWPSVLDSLADLADALGGYLVAAKTGAANWTASERIRGSIERTVNERWLERGQRFRRAAAAQHNGFLTDYDLYTDAELAKDPFYSDLLWPAGFGWGAGNTILLPTKDILVFGVERSRQRGPVERPIVQLLDTLHPHIARSALLSARLQMERARVASETLAQIGLPTLVFDETGKVIAANSLIEDETSYIQWRMRDRVLLIDPVADALFHQAIEQLNSADIVRSFALRRRNSGASMVAHVIPIRRSARDLFVRCAGMLVMTPVSLPSAPPVELIRSLFDLTPAEARVARCLALGQTVDEIAVGSGNSGNTIRTQVRMVLEKTGCRRQTEVVALLSGLTIPSNG